MIESSCERVWRWYMLAGMADRLWRHARTAKFYIVPSIPLHLFSEQNDSRLMLGLVFPQRGCKIEGSVASNRHAVLCVVVLHTTTTRLPSG